MTERSHHRPHRSPPHRATPATAYAARPKATPGADRDTHDRVRTDRIDQTGCVTLRMAGRLHHIGIGLTHAGTHVLLLVQACTCASSTPPPANCCASSPLDPTRDYQPTGRPPGPTPKKQ